MSIKIYTDASSNLFDEVIKNKNMDITVMPMTVEIDGEKYLCYQDKIDVKEFSKNFYEKMKQGHRPKTSLPNPGLMLDKMEEEVQKGNEVLFVTISHGISGTYQTCKMIADQVNEKQNRKCVEVIDSLSAGFGEGMIAMHAYELSKSISSLDELAKQVRAFVPQVRSEFIVDSLVYLTNTGRVSMLKAKIASLLSIKPLLYGSDEGKIEVTSLAHGKIKAIKKLSSQVLEHITDKNSKVIISHCHALEDALKLQKLLEEGGVKDIEIYYYDLVTGAHVGPGTIAVFYQGKNRKIN